MLLPTNVKEAMLSDFDDAHPTTPIVKVRNPEPSQLENVRI